MRACAERGGMFDAVHRALLGATVVLLLAACGTGQGGPSASPRPPPDDEPADPGDGGLIPDDALPRTGPGASPLPTGVVCEELPTERQRYDCLFEREVEPGTIVYSAPDESRVGESERVTVRLSREDPEDVGDAIIHGLQQSDGTGATPEPVEVTARMRAELDGRSAFEIDALTPELQRLRQTGFGEWRWVVTPTRPGTHPLVLTVTALLGEEPLSHVVMERTIHVDVNLPFSARRWWSENWRWVLAPGGFVALVAAAVVGRLRRRLGQRPPSAPGPSGTDAGDRQDRRGSRPDRHTAL